MWDLGRERRVGVHVPPNANGVGGLEEVRGLAADLRRDLPEHRVLIEDPDAAAVGADNEIVVVNRDIAERRRRQVEPQRLPVIAVVERDIDASSRCRRRAALAFFVSARTTRAKLPLGSSVGRPSTIFVQVFPKSCVR